MPTGASIPRRAPAPIRWSVGGAVVGGAAAAQCLPDDLLGFAVAAFLAARFKGPETVNIWPCRGEVILDIPAAQVIPFAGDGIVEELAPTRTRLLAGSWSWAALAATLARFDTEIEVIGAQSLREAFADLSGRAGRAAGSSRSRTIEERSIARLRRCALAPKMAGSDSTFVRL